ncbi:MAG: decaprenyl-phosphate phosphoribosyltransferase [Acidimicrobiales bacterium]
MAVPAGAAGHLARHAGAERGWLWGVVRTARPKQWAKNVLVFVAPGAAGVLAHPGDALRALAVFGIFCAAASGTYFVNDTVDAEADRSHPEKADRPIASGLLGARTAVATAAVLFAVALAGAWLVASWQLALAVATYEAINVAYSLRLKHVPVVELSAVASGFVVRAIAGGIGTHVPLSKWFLVVTSFGALFLVVGKRAGEHHILGDDRGSHRATLDLYTMDFLRSALTLSAAATVTTYCLWAFDRTGLGRRGDHLVWIELSVVPVIVGVLYVLRLLGAGQGGAPTELALEDRTLQLLGLAWVALVALGVYA